MFIPTEVIIAVLSRCDGPTILLCRQASKAFQAAVDGERSLRAATFGIFSQNVMVRILQFLVWNQHGRSGYQGNRGAGLRLLAFEELNSTCRRLLNHHPNIAPLLFRQGEVLRQLDPATVAKTEIDVHPVFVCISHTLYTPLQTAAFWRYYEHEDGIEHLVDAQVIDDYATMPEVDKLRIYVWDDRYDVEHEVEVSNEEGVTVRDVMTGYCKIKKPMDCVESHHLLGGMDVKEIIDGCLVLEAALAT